MIPRYTRPEMAAIWSEVLQAPEPGVFDIFFAIGGHSMLATRLVSRIRSAFGVEMPLQQVFQTPTLAGLTAALAGLERREIEVPAIEPMPADSEAPLSHAQRRMWFIDRLTPGDTLYNVPVVENLGAVRADLLERTLTEILRRHQTLRSRFPDEQGTPRLVIDPAKPLALPFTDLADLAEEARADRLLALTTAMHEHRFNLASGPLYSFHLVRLAATHHLLLANVHHIVTDGASMDILAREIAAIYAAFERDEPSPLADPPIQYADYAWWQQQWLTGDVLERDEDALGEQGEVFVLARLGGVDVGPDASALEDGLGEVAGEAPDQVPGIEQVFQLAAGGEQRRDPDPISQAVAAHLQHLR